MEAKKKYCSGCESEQYIWKNYAGNKYCKNCWFKSNKSPAIPKVSEKKKKQDVEYSLLRKKYLLKKPNCEVNVIGCTNIATDIHHTIGGQDRSVYYLIQSTWLSSCRTCHVWIHEHPLEARELKLLASPKNLPTQINLIKKNGRNV